MFSFVAAVLATTTLYASPFDIVDTTPGGATVDGVISPGEFGDGAFVNPGNGGLGFFDGLVGGGNVFLDSDTENLFVGVEFNGLTPQNDDVFVLYLDAGGPGVSSTVGLSAVGDRAQGGITGTLFTEVFTQDTDPVTGDPVVDPDTGDPVGTTSFDLVSSANVGFAPGFEFTHALVFEFGDNGFNGLFSVNDAQDGVDFIDGGFSDGFTFNGIIQSFATDAEFGPGVLFPVPGPPILLNPDADEVREVAVPLDVLGIEPGDEIGFVGTVTNGFFPFLGAEGVGFTDTGVSGNGGELDIVLQLTEFSTFTTAVPEPSTALMSALFAIATVSRRRRSCTSAVA